MNKKIEITSYDDNSYYISNGIIGFSVSWDINHWNLGIDKVLNLGDGIIPDWTSAIQYMLELN